MNVPKSIPKIIHQTWKSRILPPDFQKWSQTWKLHNPDYDYRFYTDTDCYRFMYFYYPDYVDLYESLTPVQKADVFRYLILHKYGGIYADMDTTCFRSIDTLINNAPEGFLITGLEYEGTEGMPIQYLQWFIASPPGHPALLDLVKEIERRSWYQWLYSWFKSPNSITYWLTGPELFTSVLKDSGNVRVMAKGLLGSYDPSRLSSESFLQHWFKGSWKPNWTRDRMRL